jgi:hypothetical protein
MELPDAALAAEPVIDDQVSVLDTDLEPVAAGGDDPIAERSGIPLAIRAAMFECLSSRSGGRRQLSEPTSENVLRWR